MSASRLALFSGSLLFFFLGLLPLSAIAREIQVSGRAYVDLGTVASSFGMKGYWLSGYETYRLRSRWTTIDAGKNKRILQVNQLPVYLGFPMVESRRQLFISKADYQHVLQPILTPQVFDRRPGLRRIVIDPGHGGKDSGARNDAYGLKEKQLTLDVSLRLKGLLERAGYEVVMSRDSDVYIPLEQRPQLANRVNADLFISLHFNAAGSATASGFESYALTPQFQASSKYTKPGRGDNVAYDGNKQNPWNTLMGYHLQRSLVEGLGGPDRGLKRARFLVLKHLDCPGVLLELGFVSHPGTAQKLRTVSFRQTLAQSLFEGIVAYRNRLQRIQQQ
jgi:N-acetylmuramoyl-L-alanine amidase